MDDLFGSSSTSTTTSEPFSGKQKQWYEDLQPYLFGRVTNPATYGGRTSAGLNSTQQAAIGNIGSYMYNPTLSAYASGSMIDPTKNQYVQGMANQIKSDTQDSWGNMGDQINTGYNKTGFWSGSGRGKSLEDTQSQLAKAESGALANLYNNAYQQGVSNMLSANQQQQSNAQAALSAGNTQYQVENTAAQQDYQAWLQQQNMQNNNISQYLYYLQTGKNPSTTTETESSGLGGIMGSLAGGWASTWGKACFIAGTKISTPDGDRNIEEIKVGDQVYSLDDDNLVCVESVTWTQDPLISPNNYIKVVTDTGLEVTTTDTQPFIGYNGELYPAANDEIFDYDGALVGVSEVIPVEEKQLVYDLSTTGRNIYFANGLAAKGRGE